MIRPRTLSDLRHLRSSVRLRDLLRRLLSLGGAPMTCNACKVEAEFGSEENPHPIPRRYHSCLPMEGRESTKTSWEVAYDDAKKALEFAYTAIDDIAGWSGSSGNWPLQQASGIVGRALDLFQRKKEQKYFHLEVYKSSTARVFLNWLISQLGTGAEGSDLLKSFLGQVEWELSEKEV